MELSRIELFNIPNYQVDTSKYSNLLHDNVVKQLEEKFAEYVGAEHAVALNSATSALFLICSLYKLTSRGETKVISLPSLIPQVVPNAVINAGCEVNFIDYAEWVGHSYLFTTVKDIRIIDSAQEVYEGQFKQYNSNDIIIYSFYPTKPVGSCDGGVVVSNDRIFIDEIRRLAYNGWDSIGSRSCKTIGHKMYANSIQADFALKSLLRLNEKKEKLASIREYYNKEFGLHNTSEHLYRVRVMDNVACAKNAHVEGIVCGIHYLAAHKNPIYRSNKQLQNSEKDSKEMISIPYHEKLTLSELQKVVKFVNKYRK